MAEQIFYDSSFFKNVEKTALDSSLKILPILLKEFKPKSVIDIGCGNGVWLSVFEKLGIKNYLGIDGNYVKENIFHANFSNFEEGDLEDEINLNRKFDMAFCLEVGEHLPHSKSLNLVNTICNHSDLIVFSAAIPGQTGTNHVNEQWQSYWAKLFHQKGYEPVDFLRPKIWYDTSISYWYRQNIILYKKTNKLLENFDFLNVIHPELKFRKNKVNNIFMQFLIEPKYIIFRFLKKRNLL